MICKVFKCKVEESEQIINEWLIEESRKMRDEVLVKTSSTVMKEDGELIIILFYTYKNIGRKSLESK